MHVLRTAHLMGCRSAKWLSRLMFSATNGNVINKLNVKTKLATKAHGLQPDLAEVQGKFAEYGQAATDNTHSKPACMDFCR